MRFPTTALLLTLVAGASTPAFAHGEAAHEEPAANAGKVRKEQKPWGIAGDAQAVSRTVTFAMSDDMRFTPDLIEVKQGETIRFVVRNGGKVLHEMVLGTKKDLQEHAALMLRFPGMEHDEPYMAHVAAGKTGEIVWTFNRTGRFDFACLVAGHYQAGMTGTVNVVSR